MTTDKLTVRLKRWGYARDVNLRAEPILGLLEGGNVAGFEKALATLAAEVLEDLSMKKTSPKQADDLFMIVDLYITETELREKLSVEARELLFEGLLFHHYGDRHGPDIQRMKQLIQKIRQ